MTYADGHEGWLITGHAEARAVLADSRFSSRRELVHFPVQFVGAQESPEPAAPGMFIAQDPPEHTRYRRPLAGKFTLRQMRGLVPRIKEITDACLDNMSRTGPPVDLVSAFAAPIPSQVLCELLGVPPADGDLFHELTGMILDHERAPSEQAQAMGGLLTYIAELVPRKRADPGDDLLSYLLAEDLTDQELGNIGALMLIASHETTANMLALGTFALLERPDQLEALRNTRDLTNAVEELLRYLTVIHIGVLRSATEDVEVAGQLIRAGEAVNVCLAAANRDPGRFAVPDDLDLGRQATGHLAFGHGVHQCIGQHMARTTLEIGFSALFRRFPTLRLAVDPQDIPMRSTMGVYGVHRLPVAWD